VHRWSCADDPDAVCAFRMRNHENAAAARHSDEYEPILLFRVQRVTDGD
jgi:hypothetical protein